MGLIQKFNIYDIRQRTHTHTQKESWESEKPLRELIVEKKKGDSSSSLPRIFLFKYLFPI